MHLLSCAGELNHHGKYMCDCIYDIMGEDFKRITTQQVDTERLHLGYEKNALASYNTIQTNINKKNIFEIVGWCDVMDYGAAPEHYLRAAIAQNKIVFIRIERLFKEGIWKLFIPQVFFRYYRKYIKHRNNPNVYYLCVSGYAAADLAKIGVKNERVLQWAYCPEFVEMTENDFVRKSPILELLWCGRMISWKHPETAVKIASALKKAGCRFHMKMIGTGDQSDRVRRLVDYNGLSAEVELCGAVEAKKVRDYMKAADIFLATSDQNEGWGVVINEAMNSGCAVFATPEMGAVPILIQDHKNGFVMKSNDEVGIAKEIIQLNNDPERLKQVKKNAYYMIRDHYSPQVYANTFVQLAKEAMNGHVEEHFNLGSRAKIR